MVGPLGPVTLCVQRRPILERRPASAPTAKAGRLQAYARAGAHGAFVPGMQHPNDISAIAGQIPLPLNVMWLPGMPSNAALHTAGVRRLSAGPAIFQHAWASASAATRALLAGTLSAADPSADYTTLNALFAEQR